MRETTLEESGEPSGTLDLLGRRATLRLLWELREGPLNFRALQEAAATNPAQLNIRLKELRAATLVEHAPGGYRLSERGRELLAVLEPLFEWAGQAARRPSAPAAAPLTPAELGLQAGAPRAPGETTRFTPDGIFHSERPADRRAISAS
jgi:DNA-binding HxlR family transcriptional regulator